MIPVGEDNETGRAINLNFSGIEDSSPDEAGTTCNANCTTEITGRSSKDGFLAVVACVFKCKPVDPWPSLGPLTSLANIRKPTLVLTFSFVQRIKVWGNCDFVP